MFYCLLLVSYYNYYHYYSSSFQIKKLKSRVSVSCGCVMLFDLNSYSNGKQIQFCAYEYLKLSDECNNNDLCLWRQKKKKCIYLKINCIHFKHKHLFVLQLYVHSFREYRLIVFHFIYMKKKSHTLVQN